MNAPNLTQRPPRSPRVRLGGYTILPRLLDKARATLAGTNGDYIYNNPNDGHFFRFTGITPEALLAQVKTGAGDWEMLLWVNEHAPLKRTCVPEELGATGTFLASDGAAAITGQVLAGAMLAVFAAGPVTTWYGGLLGVST